MQHGLYSIKDRVAGMFAPVFQAVNDGVARRAYIQAFRNAATYDLDSFQLFQVGFFNDENGVVEVIAMRLIEVDMPTFDEVKQRPLNLSLEGTP